MQVYKKTVSLDIPMEFWFEDEELPELDGLEIYIKRVLTNYEDGR